MDMNIIGSNYDMSIEDFERLELEEVSLQEFLAFLPQEISKRFPEPNKLFLEYDEDNIYISIVLYCKPFDFRKSVKYLNKEYGEVYIDVFFDKGLSITSA